MEHSIIFPLPFPIHLGFVIIGAILLLLCYKKRKYAYELYMLVGVVSTMFIYVCAEKPYFYILGLEEIILLILTIVDMAKVSKQLADAEKAKEQAAKEQSPTDTADSDNEEKSE